MEALSVAVLPLRPRLDEQRFDLVLGQVAAHRASHELGGIFVANMLRGTLGEPNARSSDVIEAKHDVKGA